jgi:NAD(P)-dependent dehydrogenase (short-subunit alcohol dehydrogenase family)
MEEIRIPSSFPSPGDVKGRRVVVTGASRGLGRVIATGLSGAGARLVLVGRDPASLADLAGELDGDAVACAGDVSDPDFDEAVADRAVDAFGGLDVWIANAGVSPVVAGPLETAVDDWRRIIDVNLSGVFYGARAAARVMVDGGRIIATGSVLGERPRRGLAAYSAAKGGVNALVKALALDLGPRGITVNVVSPGWFDSPLAQGFKRDERREREILDHTALGRWGTSEDLLGAYLFLCSDAAAFVTGTVVTVDGGYLCV